MFLYYLPDLQTAGMAEIKAVGLAYAFDRAATTCCVSPGPDGRAGIVLADQDGPVPGHYADRQEWRPMPGTQAWIGRYRADPLPGPEQLRRADAVIVGGHGVILGDGNAWEIPVAIGVGDRDGVAVRYCGLPRTIGWDASGQRVFRGVVPGYQDLWNAASTWWDAFFATGEDRLVRFDAVQRNECALVALRTNYRISFAEADWLQLLTERNEGEILRALIDWPGWEAIKKKRESAG